MGAKLQVDWYYNQEDHKWLEVQTKQEEEEETKGDETKKY